MTLDGGVPASHLVAFVEAVVGDNLLGVFGQLGRLGHGDLRQGAHDHGSNVLVRRPVGILVRVWPVDVGAGAQTLGVEHVEFLGCPSVRVAVSFQGPPPNISARVGNIPKTGRISMIGRKG